MLNLFFPDRHFGFPGEAEVLKLFLRLPAGSLARLDPPDRIAGLLEEMVPRFSGPRTVSWSVDVV